MQTINTPDGGTMVMLALEEYEALVDAADIAAGQRIRQRLVSGEEELLPSDMVRRLVAGETPLRVWRQYRGISAADLARQAHLSRAYISQIETGKRQPGVAALRRIARVLNAGLDDLVG